MTPQPNEKVGTIAARCTESEDTFLSADQLRLTALEVGPVTEL